jgi:hypothetical protein
VTDTIVQYRDRNSAAAERTRQPPADVTDECAGRRRSLRGAVQPGQRITLEEVAVYTVKNGLIAREQFFYAGDR